MSQSSQAKPHAQVDSERIRLDKQLEIALLDALRDAYKEFNRTLFGRAMVLPTIELSDSRTAYAMWQGGVRRLSMSRHLVMEERWSTVLEVLKHEMAHQYVQEVLGRKEEPHGRVFRDVCRRFGIDSKATGLAQGPIGEVTGRGEDPMEKLFQTVSKLLALADSAEEHEAQAAMSAAQLLILKYNLKDVKNPRRSQQYSFCEVGKPAMRISEWERRLGSILVQHFFVEGIWIRSYQPRTGKYASVLEISGTEQNLKFATYVYDFLTHTAQTLWKQHQRRTQTKLNHDRRAFLAGVMQGFDEKLCKNKQVSTERGLVWVGDNQLSNYINRRHPNVRALRISSYQNTAAREKGKDAGRNIVLRKPITESAASRKKLLTS